MHHAHAIHIAYRGGRGGGGGRTLTVLRTSRKSPFAIYRDLFTKHSARRRRRSRYGPREYQTLGIFPQSLAALPIFVYVEAISYAYAFCKANSTTTNEIRSWVSSSSDCAFGLITVNGVKQSLIYW